VAKNGDCWRVAEFGDYSRQCGQSIRIGDTQSDFWGRPSPSNPQLTPIEIEAHDNDIDHAVP